MRRVPWLITLVALGWACPAEARARHHVAHRAPRAVIDDSDNLRAIAAVYLRQDQAERAVALLDELRQRRPDDLDVLDDLIAACMRSVPCAPRRLALLRVGIAKMPQPADLLGELAGELTRLGRGTQAVAELRQFVQTHPDSDAAREMLIDAAADRDPALAAAHLSVHLQRHPSDAQGRALLAELLQDLDRAPAAKRQLDQVLRSNPENVHARVLFARRLIEADDLIGADRELARAQALARQRRAQTEAACRAEEDHECLAELEDDAKRTHELALELKEAHHDRYRDFRNDVRWFEFADDIEREQDRDP